MNDVNDHWDACTDEVDVHPDVAVVLHYFARCAETSSSIVDMYTEDAVFFDCVGPTTIRGRDAIRQQVFEPLFRGMPDFHCHDRVRHIMTSGGVVMAELEISGTHQGNLLGIPATGRSISWHTTGVWEIAEEGLIRREAYYWDVETVRKQLVQ